MLCSRRLAARSSASSFSGPPTEWRFAAWRYPDVGAFATPLGAIELDAAAIDAIKAMPQVVVSDEAHALEHSLEVHLPFLQSVLGDFKLVPLAVGYAEPREVAEVIEALWGGPETLIVVSSDLSHYLGYADANAIDRQTCEAVLALRTDIDHEQACGAIPVAGLALAARRRKLEAPTAGSAATPATRRGTSIASSAMPRSLSMNVSDDRGEILLAIARAAIARELGCEARSPQDAPWLHEPGATFVTLRPGGDLRGCIGSLEPRRPLVEDVEANAVSAAFRDPRFRPLHLAELDRTHVEVSLLSPLEPIAFQDEQQALAQIDPGVHGVTFEYGYHKSTFLPQVWEDAAGSPRVHRASQTESGAASRLLGS